MNDGESEEPQKPADSRVRQILYGLSDAERKERSRAYTQSCGSVILIGVIGVGLLFFALGDREALEKQGIVALFYYHPEYLLFCAAVVVLGILLPVFTRR